MAMILSLSDDERQSIGDYLSNLNVQGLIDLGSFLLRIGGSDELSRLVGAELASRPGVMIHARMAGRATRRLGEALGGKGCASRGAVFLDDMTRDHYDPFLGVGDYEAWVKAGVGGTPPDLADNPTADERDADRELDRAWEHAEREQERRQAEHDERSTGLGPEVYNEHDDSAFQCGKDRDDRD